MASFGLANPALGAGAGGGPVSDAQRAKALEMARSEMEYRVELFNKMTGTCFEKCTEKRYKDAELNVGETSCVDRCTAKYWQVVGMVGQMLGAASAAGNAAGP